jgi:hypothetical protein
MDFLKGTDIAVLLRLKSEGVVLQPSNLADYVVLLYAEIQGQKRLKYSFGVEDITIVDDALGEIKVIVPRSYTSIAPPANHYLEVKIKIDATSDYVDAVASKGVTGIFIGKAVESANSAI